MRFNFQHSFLITLLAPLYRLFGRSHEKTSDDTDLDVNRYIKENGGAIMDALTRARARTEKLRERMYDDASLGKEKH